jgi:hypothetical protein
MVRVSNRARLSPSVADSSDKQVPDRREVVREVLSEVLAPAVEDALMGR